MKCKVSRISQCFLVLLLTQLVMLGMLGIMGRLEMLRMLVTYLIRSYQFVHDLCQKLSLSPTLQILFFCQPKTSDYGLLKYDVTDQRGRGRFLLGGGGGWCSLKADCFLIKGTQTIEKMHEKYLKPPSLPVPQAPTPPPS